jgi:protein-tyrosine-phosphatase
MAEGALRILLSKKVPTEKYRVISAGTAAATGFPATMYAIEAAKIWNADLSKHLSQPLTANLIDQADLILAMTSSHHQEILRLRPKAKAKTFLFKNFPDSSPDGEGVEDPIGRTLETYNATFLEIGEYLGKQLPEYVKRIGAQNDAE